MRLIVGRVSFLSFFPKQVFQQGFEFGDGMAAVRDPVFFLMIQLGSGLIQRRNIEDRVVAKAVLANGRVIDSAFNSPFSFQQNVSRRGKAQAAHKAGRTVFIGSLF